MLNQSLNKSENPIINIREDIPGRFNELYLIKKEWARIVNILQGKTIPPYEVIIHPSSTCNLSCAWCIGNNVPIEDSTSSNSLILPDSLSNPENMLKVIKHIIEYKKFGSYTENGQEYTKEFKVENVSFSGLIGEPLVSKKAVMAAMQLLVDNGLRVGIFTNGVLMDKSTLDIIIRTAYVHLSLDASHGETYGKMKLGAKKNGTVLFNTILQNLANLANKRDSTPSSSLEINASFILYPENYTEVFDAARILKDIGVDYFRIKLDISGQRLLNAEQRKEARELLDKIKVELADEQFKLVEIHQLSSTDEQLTRTFSKCLITELMAAIGSDGHLYPCNYHPRPDGHSYGSAIEASFDNIWENTQRRRIKKDIPHICPPVCDPFKNRSNRLLNCVYDIYLHEDLHKLEVYKNKTPVPVAI